MQESKTTEMQPYQIENLKRWAKRKEKTVKMKVGLLDDIMELLQIAYYSACKDGLRNKGADCRLPHEVRMFAWYFSDKDTSKPEHAMTDGGGTYQEIRQKVREVYEQAS